jgi:arylsulfatase A-like enzyme
MSLRARLLRYLPFQNIHGPYTCDGEYRAMYAGSKFTDGEQTMFGYITEMDTKVGEIMTQLATAPAQLNNTIIIFSRYCQRTS